jgi:dipeptidyl aminopeptidase/acylaminoacyl peptidase
MRLQGIGFRDTACWLVPWLAATTVLAQSTESAGPTVREVVEVTRIIQPLDGAADAMQAVTSPDGTKAFIVTRRAEVATDLNYFDVVLLDVRADRLAAGRVEPPRVLLRVKSFSDEYYADPAVQAVRWADSRTLLLLARISDASDPSPVLPQVYRLDVGTGELKALTRAADRIVSFAVSRDLRRVVYAVQLHNPPLAGGSRSIVVGNQSFWAVKFGQHDLRSQDRLYRYFVADSGREPRPLGEAFGRVNLVEPQANISPDGRWAILPRFEPGRQLAWGERYPMVAELTRSIGPSVSIDPLSYFSRPTSYVARRMVAFRLDDGSERVVVDAPDDAMPGGSQVRQDRLWQGDGRSVVVAGTHLPMRSGKPFLSGSHIIEYWPDTGTWEVIAELSGRLHRAYAPDDKSFVAVDGDRGRRFVRRSGGPGGSGGRWREVDPPAAVKSGAGTDGSGWALRFDEALNRPPEIVAAGPAGQQVKLTNLNPQFSAESWGSMRPHIWHDIKGRRWEGGLMTGRAHKPGSRHPLVIQTYGFAPGRFYLDGPNPSIGYTSAFAGRAFLREGIVVLAMPWAPTTGRATKEREGVRAFAEGVRGAIDSLVASGLVDPARVGIIGWSATGEMVLNLLTFSDVQIRAATMADGDSNTLFSTTVSYGAGDDFAARAERLNEGTPFGASRDNWVRNDPALNSECVRSAVRIESYGPWVLPNWDFYWMLRRQYKPAEMVLIPGGSHSLSRPSERMVSLQGNVDWYRFWLKGEERTEAFLAGETRDSLAAQYVRWRQMQAMKKDEPVSPRCKRAEPGK